MIKTNTWLKNGTAVIYTQKNKSRYSTTFEGHRWMFVYSRGGIATSGGGHVYGEIDTKFSDGFTDISGLDLPLPDTAQHESTFDTLYNAYHSATNCPAIAHIDLDSLLDALTGKNSHQYGLNAGLYFTDSREHNKQAFLMIDGTAVPFNGTGAGGFKTSLEISKYRLIKICEGMIEKNKYNLGSIHTDGASVWITSRKRFAFLSMQNR